MSTKYLLSYTGKPGSLKTTYNDDGTMSVTLVDDGGKIASCLESFKNLKARPDRFCELDLEYVDILIHPRKHFMEIINDSTQIPEIVLQTILKKIDELTTGHRIVFVHLVGSSECEYSDGWHVPLLTALFQRHIFVDVNREYSSQSRYARLHLLNKNDVLKMTESRL